VIGVFDRIDDVPGEKVSDEEKKLAEKKEKDKLLTQKAP